MAENFSLFSMARTCTKWKNVLREDDGGWLETGEDPTMEPQEPASRMKHSLF